MSYQACHDVSFPRRRESSPETALEERQMGQYLPKYYMSSLRDFKGLDSRLRGNDSVVTSYESWRDIRVHENRGADLPIGTWQSGDCYPFSLSVVREHYHWGLTPKERICYYVMSKKTMKRSLY